MGGRLAASGMDRVCRVHSAALLCVCSPCSRSRRRIGLCRGGLGRSASDIQHLRIADGAAAAHLHGDRDVMCRHRHVHLVVRRPGFRRPVHRSRTPTWCRVRTPSTLTVDDRTTWRPFLGSQQVSIAAVPNISPSVTVNPPGGTVFRTGSTFTMTSSDPDGTICTREWRVDGGGFAVRRDDVQPDVPAVRGTRSPRG